jgi:F0F1-type ATP synthase membrane subunit b/b'
VRQVRTASVTRNRRHQSTSFTRAATVALVAVCVQLALAAGTPAWSGLETLGNVSSQPAPGTAPAEAHAGGGETGTSPEATHKGSSWGALAARVFNFTALAGTLIYFLRSPLLTFLAARRAEIRAALVKAAELSAKSARHLAEVERRMAALPAEIDALRARGAADVAAEEKRIAAEAEADRVRLTEQAKRQIDLQLRVAKRELIAHAADLAVKLATERIRLTIRDDDQRRLVEAYLSHVKVAAGGGAAPGTVWVAGGQS